MARQDGGCGGDCVTVERERERQTGREFDESRQK